MSALSCVRILCTNTHTANGLGGLGGDVWSESAFLTNYLHGSLNDTDVLGGGSGSFWAEIFDEVYFGASEWRTINGGLNRLPLSFHPLVNKNTHMNRKIERVTYTQSPGKGNAPKTPKVELSWRDNTPKTGNGHGHGSNKDRDTKLHTSTYDYALISAPFSVVRSWRMPAALPTTIRNAINHIDYTAACKVALEYSSRFWEHYANPILGGCSTTSDIPGIGSICYPSYNLGGKGKATILASYDSANPWLASLSEEDHVQYVLDAMTEIHGEESRKLYTGKYNRRCWAHDALEAGSWASPSIGQHQLYIPEYFKTYDGVGFCLCGYG